MKLDFEIKKYIFSTRKKILQNNKTNLLYSIKI